MSSITAKVRTGAFWVAASRGLINALSLISIIVLARILIPTDFGVVAIGTAILAIATSATDLSLTQAIIHHEAPDRRHLDCVWTLNFLRGAALAILLLLTAPLVAHLYHDKRLTTVMGAISLAALLAGVTNPRLIMLKRDLLFWQDFIVNTSQKLALSIFSIVIAIIYKSYIALVVGIIASQVLSAAISFAIAPYRPRFRLREYKEFIAFSGWLTLGQIVSTLNWRMDPLIIGRFLGPHGLGLFTVASNLAQIPSRETTQPLIATLFPAFRKLRDHPDRLRKAFTRAQTLVTAIALPAGTLLGIVAAPLVSVALGPKWQDATPIVQVLSITLAFNTVASNAQAVAMASGRTRQIFRRQLQVFLFRLPVIVTGLWIGQLGGLLIARVIVSVISTGMDMLLVREVAGLTLRQQIFAHWRTVTACTVMWFGGTGLSPHFYFGPDGLARVAEIVSLGSASFAIYLICLVGLWLASRRPQGAESEVFDVASRLYQRLIRRPSQ